MSVAIAQTLAADSTYRLMTPAERIEEARALMRSAGMDDDPMDAAAAVEAADALGAPVEPQEFAPGLEGCRENRTGCSAPIAANGRCLDCGAYRQNPALIEQGKVERDALLFGTGFMVDGKRVDPADVFIRSTPTLREPPSGFLGRYKASSGNNDRVIAELIGKGRSTVQAMVGGAVPEVWTPSALAAVADAIDSQVSALLALRTELGIRS